jgi:hypothetical protein
MLSAGKAAGIIKTRTLAQRRRMAGREECMTISRRNFARLAATGGAVAVASPAIAEGAIKWRLASSFPKSLEGLWGASPTLAKYVNEMSGGKFTIEPFAAGEIVPGLQVLDAVAKRHRRVRPFLRRILHRQESDADLRRVASVRDDAAAKLRELIVTLQKQMGDATTGVLTYGQFSKLQDAARNIDERQVYVAPGKFVSSSDDGNVVSARGTGVMADLANPININRMFCTKSDSMCEMSAAEFDLQNGMLLSAPPTVFEIKTWTPNRITAISERPCGTATLTVDVGANDVAITSVPHTDLPFCSKEPANIWKLADGFRVSWNLYRDRYNKARGLVYEPERDL